MSLQLDLQTACTQPTPDLEKFQLWAEHALGDHREHAELSIRIVDEQEGSTLNQQYRGKTGPTNVLSFPAEIPEELGIPLLGDLAICAAVVEREAIEQNKPLDAHWAHMIIHGTLHLLGYDHINDDDAIEMETLETQLLQKLGYDDPYHSNETTNETETET